MVARILLIASAACVFNLANGFSDPFPGFHPCKKGDSDCILDNTRKGIETFAKGYPELKISPLDPLNFNKIDASSPNLKFIVHDVEITGLNTCKPVEAKTEPDKSKMTFAFQCDLKLQGNYEMDGQLLVLKFKGDGKINVFLPKVINRVEINHFTKEGKDGKKHLRIKNYKHSYELKEKSQVSFEGLFQESEILGKATNDVIMNSSDEIVKEIGGPVFDICVKMIAENISKFFKAYSIEELTLA